MNPIIRPFTALLLLAAIPARAGDFDSEAFALRYTAALSRLSTYPDVAGQAGASAASLRSTSVNPAALSWLPIPNGNGAPGFKRFALSAQYTGLFFDRGTDIWATTQSLNIYPSREFAIKLAVTQLRSNEDRTREGAIFETDTNAYRVDFSWYFDRPEHPFSVGLQLSYSQSETNFSRPPVTFQTPRGPLSFDRQVAADSDRESFGVRFGWQISLLRPESARPSGDGKAVVADAAQARNVYDRWLFGIVADYVFQPTKVGDYRERLRSGLRTPGSFDRQDFNQTLVRVGTAVRYTPESWVPQRRAGYVRLDYQWGRFANETRELQTSRLYLGGNFPVHAAIDLTAGTVVDDRRNVAWSVGAGVHSFTWSVDVAYQHDMLPEIATDFGNAHTFVASAAIAF